MSRTALVVQSAWDTTQVVVQALPVPSFGIVMPPGFDKAGTILGWVAGGVAALLLGCWIVGVGRLARASHRGEQTEAGGHLGSILVCALLLGAASAIFTAL